MKKINYYVTYGIAIFHGGEKAGELKFNTEDDMWETLKKLDKESYDWQSGLKDK